MKTINEFSSDNFSDEFRKELENTYGHRVKRSGNLSKDQFFNLIIKDVVEAEYIIPIDFNDIRTILDYAQEVDAVSTICKATDFPLCMASAINKLKLLHPQSEIRNLAIIISINGQNTPSPEYIQPMSDVLQSFDCDIVWCLAKRDDVTIGDIAVTIIAGFYQDINNDKVRISLSKKLAYLLRHSDLIDSQGFCQVITAMQHIGVTYDELKIIVEKDNKNRFEIVGTDVVEGRIRARNGHSGKVKIDPGLTLEPPPITLYHATTSHAWEKIKEEGLKPMSRQYVHLSEDPKVAIESAKRHKGTPILLEVNAYSAFTNGIHFYRTSNGVWYTERIPYYYLRKIDISGPNDI